MNNCGIFMRKYRYIHILLNCKNVGMDTGLCVSMCKWMSVFESCYCTKAPQTMQIITVDALVKKPFPSYFNMQKLFYNRIASGGMH